MTMKEAQSKNYFTRGTRLRMLLHIHSAWFAHERCGLKVVPQEIEIVELGIPQNPPLEHYSFMSDSEE